MISNIYIRKSRSTPSVRSYDRWQPFCEDLTCTLQVRAEKATDMQLQTHCAAHPGQIRNLSHIARVNPCRTPMTERTLRLLGARRDHDSDRLFRGIDELQM